MRNRFMKRAGLGLALSAALALGACGSGGEATSSSGPAVGELTVETTFGSTAITDTVKAFERANPKVHVKVIQTNLPEMDATLPLQLRAGRAPDVVYSTLGFGEPIGVQNLAPKGLLTDLSDQPWAKDVPDTVRFSITQGGKVYAYPTDTILLGGIYDKKVFARLGIEPPKTFSDVLALCRRATSEGLVGISVGGLDSYPLMLAHYPIVASTAFVENPNFSRDRLDDKVTFAGSPGWVESIDRMNQLNHAGCFGPSVLGVSWDEANRRFAVGKALMMATGNSLLPAIRNFNPHGDFAMFPFPGTDDAADMRVPFGPSVGLIVPSSAKHKELAVRFLAFAATAFPRFARQTGTIPAMSSHAGADLPPYAQSLAPYLKDNETAPLFNDYWPNPEVSQRYRDGMAAMFLGKSDPLAISKQMDDVWTSTVPR